MAAPHDTSANDRKGGPALHLVAAQADAQRFADEGPLLLWRPSSSRRWAAGACTVALLVAAAAWWWWPAGEPVDAAAPPAAVASPQPGGTAPAWVPPADTAAPVVPADEAPDEVALPICDRAGCPGLATPPTMAGEAADPDAWALNPEPGPAASQPGFRSLANIPEIPDENDTTPAEETNPEQDAGDVAEK